MKHTKSASQQFLHNVHSFLLSRTGFVLLLPPLVYFLLSLRFVGPAYLSDEIGYLAKAATLGGETVDAANAVHAGYSLLVAPVYALFSSPEVAWKGVLAINALMYAISLRVLFHILREVFPKKKPLHVLAAVLFASAYPGWIMMSGYAYPTTALVFVSTVALYFMLKAHKTNTPLQYATLGLFTGYMYWVHPTTFVFITVLSSYMVLHALVNRRFKNIMVFVAVVALVVLVYQRLFHPWLIELMNPEGFESEVFYGLGNYSLSDITESRTWIRWAAAFAAQSSYLVISSFGLIVYPLMSFVAGLINKGRSSRSSFKEAVVKTLDDRRAALIVILSLSTVGVVLMISFFSGLNQRVMRVDHWLYGRYAEVFVLPLLAAGILSLQSFKRSGLIALYLVFSGVVAAAVITPENTWWMEQNIVNMSSFWPVLVKKETDFFGWFALAAAAVLVVAFARRYVKNWAYLAVLPVFGLMYSTQSDWHANILSEYSRPPLSLEFIAENYSEDQCMGFEYVGDQHDVFTPTIERIRLTSYYLYRYDYERMSFADWFERCDGPFITSSTVYDGNPDVTYVAREARYNVFIIVKTDQLERITAETVSEDDNSLYVDVANERCVVSGCFAKTAQELVDLRLTTGLVSDLVDEGDALVSQGEPSSLFYGPYHTLQRGAYRIKVSGKAFEQLQPGHAHLVLKHSSASVVVGDFDLAEGPQDYFFEIQQESIDDLEVEVSIRAEDVPVKIEGYEIELAQ